VSPLVAILIVALLAVVALVLSAPLRAARRQDGGGGEPQPAQAPPAPQGEPVSPFAREELEAAREAKYREIRDAELDYRTGKLSREDYEGIDGELRAEAIEILNRLEALEPHRPTDDDARTSAG
jgi:hypothetical protein